MSIDILDDCVEDQNGTLYCYDRRCGEYFALRKEKLLENNVPREVLLKFVRKYADEVS